jgi:hypothetical protein
MVVAAAVGGATSDVLAAVLLTIIAVAIAIILRLVSVVIRPFLIGIDRLRGSAIKLRSRGVSRVVFLLAMIWACLEAVRSVAAFEPWLTLGPLLLFLGLFTLLSAPFDWASLGLTRALLRRGLEIGGWWPYALALVDAAFAAATIAALALTLVLGVQAFNALAYLGSIVPGLGYSTRLPVLRLDEVFDGITAQPSAPEYWWLYALLLSTMIPSLVNLVIGGASLVRGLPGVPSLLLRKIPAQGNVPKFDRAWIATVLTAQVAAGAALGIAAQALLVVVVIGYIMPFFGLELLDMAREVAAFNLPARVGQLFGVPSR